MAYAGIGVASDGPACEGTATCQGGGGGGTVASISAAHTVSGGANPYIIVAVGSSTAVSGVTYRGVGLTAITPVASNGCIVSMWGGVPAASGSNTVVASGGSNMHMQFLSFVNVNGATTYTPTKATGTSATMSVNSNTNTAEVVFDYGCTADFSAARTITFPANNASHPIRKKLSSGSITTSSPFINGGGMWRNADETAGDVLTTVSYGLSAATSWAINTVSLKPAGGSAIMVDRVDAEQSGDGVDVRWRTGSEIDNLGFHVYRDDGQGRFRLTATPIIGAALLTGSGISLAAGQQYGFRDILSPGRVPAARYWLEDIDMNGTRTMHGPVYPVQAPAPSPSAPARPSPAPPAPPVETTLALSAAPFMLPEAPLSVPAVLDDRQPADRQWQLAAGTGIKIGVNQTGWHQLTGADLMAAGLSPNTDPRQLSLFLEGREVPIEVREGNGGVLADSDTVGFYGQAINANSTDTRVYWLTDRVGSPARIQADAGGVPAPGLGARSLAVPFVSEWRPRGLYFAALTNGEDDNFFGPLIGADPVTQHLTLADRAPEGTVTVEVGVQGVSLTPHAVSVEIGGQTLGQIVMADHDRRSVAVTVPESAITDGGFDLALRSSGDTDLTLVDFARVSFRRNAVAVEGQAQFVLAAGEAVSVGGFTPGEGIQVLDVADPEAPRLVSAGPADDAGQIPIAASSAGARSLLVRLQGQATAPAFVAPNLPSRLHENSNRGDLVVVGAADLLAAFQPLKDLRESQGWVVALVDVQDVYDEFSFGTRHPGAIRAFMTRARQWASPPRALILLGDATFDPRDFLGKGSMDRVPTKLFDTQLMESATDDWFTDFDDDGIADVPVGRLPARTLADAVTMVSKLVEAPLFASADEAASAVPALFVADSLDGERGYDFPAISRDVSGVVAPPWKTTSFQRGEPGMEAPALQALLRTRPAFIGYTGHGSEGLWAGGLLGADNLDAELGVGGPSAFWMDLTCLNGFFHDVYQRSLAEELLLRPDAGAFGIWASSALTEVYWQRALGRAFVDQLWNRGATVGEAAMRAKRLVNDTDIRRSWILFGDPTWRPAMFVDPASADAGVTPSGDAATADAPGPRVTGGAGCSCTTAGLGGNDGDLSRAGAALFLAIGAALRRRRRAPSV